MNLEFFKKRSPAYKLRNLMERERSILSAGDVVSLQAVSIELTVALKELSGSKSKISRSDLEQLSDDFDVNQRLLQSARTGLLSAYRSLKSLSDPNTKLNTYDMRGMPTTGCRFLQEKKF